MDGMIVCIAVGFELRRVGKKKRSSFIRVQSRALQQGEKSQRIRSDQIQI